MAQFDPPPPRPDDPTFLLNSQDQSREASNSTAGSLDLSTLHAQLEEATRGQYEIRELLGQGGMGIVFRAYDAQLQRDVAIKVLQPQMGTIEELRVRLLREAQTAGSLSHPHIVPIHAAGEHGPFVWFAMTYIEGVSLKQLVERVGPLPAPRALSILQSIAQALAYGHAKGVVHRDIKPDNIMIERHSGRPLLMDYGISQVRKGVQLTVPGQIMGTPLYMAPEQAEGGGASASSDQYSLGLVGYYMLTGENAISAGSLPELIAWHIKKTPVDLTSLGENVSINLCRALERSLASNPGRRFGSMEDLLDALGECSEKRQDAPAPARQFIRETERTIILICMCGVVTGLIGLGNTPPAFALLLLFFLVLWLESVHWLRRSGLGWDTLKETVRTERYRRAEESGLLQKQKTGMWYLVTMAAICIVGGILLAHTLDSSTDRPIRPDWPLLLFSSYEISELLPSRKPVKNTTKRWRILGLGLVALGAFDWFDSSGIGAFPSSRQTVSIAVGIVVLLATLSRRFWTPLVRRLVDGMDWVGSRLLPAERR
jgi:serine/threonine protein kinase